MQKIIDNDLNIQISQLQQLQKYHLQFMDLLRTSDSQIQIIVNKHRLQSIIDNVEKINLKIVFKTKMLGEMERILVRI